MSIKITSQVWERRYGSHAKKLVLLALADFSNDAGYSWPSIETVARKAEVSARHARRMIQELEAEGVLCTNRDGRRNTYLVTVGQSDGQLVANLRRYFGFTAARAGQRVAQIRRVEEAIIAAAMGEMVSGVGDEVGDTVSGREGTGCPVSGQLEREKGTPCLPIGDTVSPYPSVSMHESSEEPSVDPSGGVGLFDPLGKTGEAGVQWVEVLDRLRAQMTRSAFEPYLAGSRVVSANELGWRVALPSEAAVELVTGRLAPLVARTMVRLGCPVVKMVFVVGGGGDGGVCGGSDRG